MGDANEAEDVEMRGATEGARAVENQNSSVLLEGYRALGYYASNLPLSVVRSDQDVLIASCVGDHAFYVYDSAHLNLTYMSKYISDPITYIQLSPDGFVYTALETMKIISWKKMHQVQEFQWHTKPIIKFIVAGEFLFSLAEEGEFIIFNRMKGNIIKKINFETHFDNFIHPSTYLNKLLFSNGNVLQIWNIMTSEQIFDFKDILGSDDVAITCIEQSPVVDVIALGFEDG